MFGSLVANSAFVFGIAALIKPVYINPSSLTTTSIFMFLGTLAALVLMEKENVNWKHGLILIGIYVLFLVFEFVF